MVKRITKVLVLTLVIFAIIPICVMAKTDFIARLDGIENDIAKLKEEYNNTINTHSEVIDSLSVESKGIVNSLSSNILSSNINEKLNTVKTELESSSKEGAADVLNAITSLEDNAKNLINENKEILDEFKNNCEALTEEETKLIVEKVKNIMLSVGVDEDSKEAYEKTLNIFDNVHKLLLGVNKKTDNLLKNNVSMFSETLTIKLVDDILDYAKNKDMEKVIETLKEAINNVPKTDELKQELSSIENDISSIESKLKELTNLDEQDMIMLKDIEIKGISEKLKLIEKDYIDFVKVIINEYSDIYLKVVFNKSKSVSIDKMIEYANKALDIIDERESIITDLDKNIMSEELMSKAGILAALGTIDFSSYDKEYININFSQELEKIATFLIDEVIDYIDNIDSVLKKEVKDSIANSSSLDLTQDSVININASRFATVEKLKNLQTRVEKELLSTQEKLKDKLSKYAPRVYDIFNTNILDTIETIMSLENEKAVRAYEYNDVYSYIVPDTFIEGKDFIGLIGIPEKNQNILEFNKLSEGKVRTGSTLTIKLSDYVYQIYYYAVLGDVDGNCVVDSMDMYKVIQHILENSKLKNEFYRAGNTNNDSKIDSMDMYNIIQIILKK